MASIYQGKDKKHKRPNPKSRPNKGNQGSRSITVTIDAWDLRGRGISRNHQPILFVDDALPGETCQVTITKAKRQVCEGRVTRVVEAASQRREPFCPLYSQCGGCQLQHVDRSAAVDWRQQALDSQIRHKFGIAELPWVKPILSDNEQYRRKTRLAVDARKDKALTLGFRSAKSDSVVNVSGCPVLAPGLNALLPALHTLLAKLKGRTSIGHISLLQADNGIGVTFRCTRPVNEQDKEVLKAFATEHNLLLRLDFGDHSEALYSPVEQLNCKTGDGLTLAVTTEDFVQVNAAVNRAMVEQALSWLAPVATDKVLDLFSGLGNFSVPIAKRASSVTAVEGVSTMVQRGEKNAQQQGISNINWRTADLSDDKALAALAFKKYQKILLDPSREGAFEVCQQIATSAVESVVYVSCNPATFIRDLGLMLAAGWQISKIGLMEMFPYTQHIELMAQLERAKQG